MFLLRQLYFMFFAQFSNFSSVLTFQNAFQKLFCNHKEKKTYLQSKCTLNTCNLTIYRGRKKAELCKF